jgi:hypothetical protein
MRRLLILIPALAVLCGCDGGLYYQTRYIPTDIESSFAIESLAWGGDSEVIELPAAPPDVDGVHRARVDCTYPYQKFKSQTVVAIGDAQVRSLAGNDGQPIAKTSDLDHPVGPDVAMRGPKVAVYANSPYQPGLPSASGSPTVSAMDRRPHTKAVTETADLVPRGGFNANGNPYCCGDGPPKDEQAAPTTSTQKK